VNARRRQKRGKKESCESAAKAAQARPSVASHRDLAKGRKPGQPTSYATRVQFRRGEERGRWGRRHRAGRTSWTKPELDWDTAALPEGQNTTAHRPPATRIRETRPERVVPPAPGRGTRPVARGTNTPPVFKDGSRSCRAVRLAGAEEIVDGMVGNPLVARRSREDTADSSGGAGSRTSDGGASFDTSEEGDLAHDSGAARCYPPAPVPNLVAPYASFDTPQGTRSSTTWSPPRLFQPARRRGRREMNREIPRFPWSGHDLVA